MAIQRAVGTLDPSFVHQGFANVSGTKVIPIDATRLAIARSFINGQDLALHDGAGQRVPSFGGTGLITLPYNVSIWLLQATPCQESPSTFRFRFQEQPLR